MKHALLLIYVSVCIRQTCLWSYNEYVYIYIFKLDKQQDKQFQDFFDDLMIFGRIPLSEINYPTPLPDDRKSR